MSEKSEREQEKTSENEGKIDIFEFLSDFLRGFRRIWWLIPALACLGGGLTFGRAVRQYRPMYQSQASFTVTTAAASQDGYSYSFYYDSSTVKQMAATFPYILESNLLTDLVKSDLGVDAINGTITASAVADSNLFTLTVTSSDPQDAYDILEAVIRHYSEVSAYVIGDTQLNMIEAPKEADQPYNERPGISSAAKGAAAGVVLAVLIQLIYGRMKKAIRKEDDIKDILNVQCLGLVPKVTFKKHRTEVDPKISLLNRSVGSGFRESVRAIALRMDQECQKKQQKVILITGTAAGEGVSVIARNLSYALVELGKRVVLINGDLQAKPEHPREYGLEDLLYGTCSLADAVSIEEEGHIMYLECRKGMQEKKLLSMGEAVGKVIQPFWKVMDYIIIDAPPCTSLSHTALFAEHADVIAYVVRQNQEAVGRVLEGIEEVSGYGASFGGCILSQVQESGLAGYGYGKYGKYYGNYSYRHYGYGYRYGHYGYHYGYGEDHGQGKHGRDPVTED